MGDVITIDGFEVEVGSPTHVRLINAGRTPSAPVETVPEQDKGLAGLGREALDELAAGLGIEAPDKLANKAAVIAAIEQKQAEDASGSTLGD